MSEMNEFFAQLAEILEVDAVSPDDILDNFEAWDSLGVLSVIAMLGERYGITVFASDLAKVKTIGELQSFVTSKGG